jgi:hypothetical protein
MAKGPDPNRWQPTDPDLSPKEEEEGGGLGDPSSTRLGLPSWTIVVLAVLVAAVVLVLLA